MEKLSQSFLNGSSSDVIFPLYENYLEEKGIHNRENRGYKYFHPSSFGDCIRKIAIQYHSEKNEKLRVNTPIDIKFMRICDAGHAFHSRMQYDLAQMGILRGWWKCRSCGEVLGKEEKIGIFMPETCECMSKSKDKRKGMRLFEYEEISLKSEPEYNFRGNCDGIVELEPGNEDTRYVVDFKTINGDSFSYLKNPEYKYVVQITIYMWLSGVRKGVIYYEDKNRHQIKEFKIGYNTKLIDDIKGNAIKLKRVVEMGKIPKIPSRYLKTKKPCTIFKGKKCDFYDFCYK